MKSLVWVPVGIVLAAVTAAGVLRGVTGASHVREVMTAAAIAVVAAELSLVPLVLTRQAGQIAVTQAALGGTLILLFLMISVGAAAYTMRLVDNRQLFMFLLMGFYWISLVFTVIAMIKAVRRAHPEPKPSAAGAQAKGAP